MNMTAWVTTSIKWTLDSHGQIPEASLEALSKYYCTSSSCVFSWVYSMSLLIGPLGSGLLLQGLLDTKKGERVHKGPVRLPFEQPLVTPSQLLVIFSIQNCSSGTWEQQFPRCIYHMTRQSFQKPDDVQRFRTQHCKVQKYKSSIWFIFITSVNKSFTWLPLYRQ